MSARNPYDITKEYVWKKQHKYLRQGFPEHALGASDERLHVARIVSVIPPAHRRCLVEELFSSSFFVVSSVQGPCHLPGERKDVTLDLLGRLSDRHGISFHLGQSLHRGRVLFR